MTVQTQIEDIFGLDTLPINVEGYDNFKIGEDEIRYSATLGNKSISYIVREGNVLLTGFDVQ